MKKRSFLKLLGAAVISGFLGYSVLQDKRIKYNYEQLKKYATGIYTYSSELRESFDVLYELSLKEKLTPREAALLANLREKILVGMNSIYEKNRKNNEGENYDANVEFYNKIVVDMYNLTLEKFEITSIQPLEPITSKRQWGN